VLTGPDGHPDLLIASDFPLQGAFGITTQPMAAAVAYVLRQHRFRAGRFRVGLQACDDSLAQTGQPDATKCLANAKAYARNASVVGVIGPMNSFCTEAMLPQLNRARGGPVTMVSPTNSAVQLVRPDPRAPPSLLRKLYPTGQRAYARVYPSDDVVQAAVAQVANRLGHGSAYYANDSYVATGAWPVFFRRGARRVGLRLAGSETWDPEAKDFRGLARRARASGAGAVVVDGNAYTGIDRVLRALRAELGRRFPIIGTEQLLPISQLFTMAGKAARGVHIVVGGLPLRRLAGDGGDFVRGFAATRPGGRVTPFDAYTATAAEVLLDAIARSDRTRESISRALAVTHLSRTPLGPVDFTAHGELRTAQVTVVRAEKGGAPVLVDGLDGGVVEEVIEGMNEVGR
jgi:ABC-type branched-subunit amino acid transport system substrate-binding protein